MVWAVSTLCRHLVYLVQVDKISPAFYYRAARNTTPLSARIMSALDLKDISVEGEGFINWGPWKQSTWAADRYIFMKITQADEEALALHALASL